MIKEYHKLVRDKIPDIIEKSGKKPVVYKIEDEKLMKEMLVAKLKEEVEEYCVSMEAEELADILEVIYALAEKVHNIDFGIIENLRKEKEIERGGFKEGIVLEKVMD